MTDSASISVADAASEPEAPIFRPSKKRKIYRKRAIDDDTASAENNSTTSAPAPSASPSRRDSPGGADETGSDEAEGARVSMAEILRLRKLRKHRVGGVEFHIESPTTLTSAESTALTVPVDSELHPAEAAGVQAAAARRFAKQTGMISDVDKHM